MTVATLLEAAGSGRSAPSASRLKPYRNEGGRPAKPAVDLPSEVCNFRLSEVRNFRLALTRCCHAATPTLAGNSPESLRRSRRSAAGSWSTSPSSLPLALHTRAACCRQTRQHRYQRHRPLQLQARRLRPALLPLARPASLSFLLGLLGVTNRRFARRNRCRVPRPVPGRVPPSVRLTNAVCSRPARSLAAKPTRARENVASLGTAPALSELHRRRNGGSILCRSASARVVGTSNTALAGKARAKAARLSGGRPCLPRSTVSTCTNSKTAKKHLCRSLSGPSS